jgi:hypothetical protein
VGAAGAALAVAEAIEEVGPGRVVDMVGERLPARVRTPAEIYSHSLARTGGVEGTLRALLLDNGRAVVFAGNPDVAIYQSLRSPYTTAQEAIQDYNKVRWDAAARARRIHQFAVGEVKTASDTSGLHERLALGSRETREEVRTDRFLVMAILTQEFLTGSGSGRRRASGFTSPDVERFNHIFNLYFAWGYDGARSRHAAHWERFKAQIADWCGFN